MVAFRAGGALDTVIEGETGVFFKEQTPQALAEAVRALQGMTFVPDRLHEHALRFDTAVFKREMTRFVEEQYAAHRRELGAAAR